MCVNRMYKRTYNAEKDATDIVFGGKVGLVKRSREAIEGNTFNKRTVIAAFGKSNVEKSRLNLVYVSAEQSDGFYQTPYN